VRRLDARYQHKHARRSSPAYSRASEACWRLAGRAAAGRRPQD
jgi:hypothetical protein